MKEKVGKMLDIKTTREFLNMNIVIIDAREINKRWVSVDSELRKLTVVLSNVENKEYIKKYLMDWIKELSPPQTEKDKNYNIGLRSSMPKKQKREE